MKIGTGYLRGQHIHCPSGLIRPMTGKIRESMFSILGNIKGMSILDLFSGSGIVALEAISRGATRALLIEKDIGKKKTLYHNMEIIRHNPSNPAAVIKCLFRPVEHILKQLARKQPPQQYDIVFMDPPFPMKKKENLLLMADKAYQPVPEGSLILHYPAEDGFYDSTGNLKLYDYRKYGRSRLAFFTRHQ